jgi:hypothetical protein
LRIARITLDDGDVVDRKRGCRIVVEDGPQACAVGDRRVDRVGEDDRVRLIRFVEYIAVHLHSQRLRGLPGRDRQCPARGLVVAGRVRVYVACRVVDCGRLVAGDVERDREDCRGRAGVAFGDGDVVDGEPGEWGVGLESLGPREHDGGRVVVSKICGLVTISRGRQRSTETHDDEDEPEDAIHRLGHEEQKEPDGAHCEDG